MKRFYLVLLVIGFSLHSGILFSQKNDQKSVDSIFRVWGEIYFKFKVENKIQVDSLTSLISIDNYKDKEVSAYASRDQFKEFQLKNIPYTILPNPGGLLKESEINPEPTSMDKRLVPLWNFYPKYQQYLDTMLYFATAYPEICRLDTIGTSVLGRKILALKISDSVNFSNGEPEFLYTSSIHGDETTGYILMLHLADSLLQGYGVSSRITNIVNNTEIYINPMANPDGMYRNGTTLTNPIRENYNGYDLNRNFPDPGFANTGAKQPETLAFMDYADRHHFVMSANFHGGAEVYNYPWDRWYRLTADDDWWQFTGREYADTIHKYSPSGYFTMENNGVTNGAAWYTMVGGRQDYMNFFEHCREVTIELSYTKFLPASKLIAHWNYNYHSLLNFLEQVNYGFQGTITDTVTGERLQAKVFILNHDLYNDSSFVYSKLPSGFYARPIHAGIYDVTFSAPGYFSKTITGVNIINYNTLHLDVQLRPLTFDINEKTVRAAFVFPNPSPGQFGILLPLKSLGEWQVGIFDITGKKVYNKKLYADRANSLFQIDLCHLPSGLYMILLDNDGQVFQDKVVIQK